MPYVYRRPFDYAQRTRRDVLPHTQSVEISKASITFTPQPFSVDFTSGAESNGYRPRNFGIYRKSWNYAERIRRTFPQRFLGAEFTSATIAFVPRAFDITATAAAVQGTPSTAYRSRIGVFRKQWNYAERNARPEITWIEQAPSTTLELTKATIAFSARPFTIDASKNFNLTKATVTFAPRAFTLLYAPTVPFTTANIAFRTWPLTLGGATNVVSISRARIEFVTLHFDLIYGPGPYTPANVTVLAFRDGLFNGLYRSAGETFVITSPFEFSPYWMTLVDTPPDDWQTLLPRLVEDYNRHIFFRPLTSEEAQDWADNGVR